MACSLSGYPSHCNRANLEQHWASQAPLLIKNSRRLPSCFQGKSRHISMADRSFPSNSASPSPPCLATRSLAQPQRITHAAPPPSHLCTCWPLGMHFSLLSACLCQTAPMSLLTQSPSNTSKSPSNTRNSLATIFLPPLLSPQQFSEVKAWVFILCNHLSLGPRVPCRTRPASLGHHPQEEAVGVTTGS